MVSRSAKVGQAFGSKGVLSKASASVVEEVGGGGVEEATNDSAALGTGTAGALKFATNRKTLHMYDGTEWDRIAGGTDAAPVITEDAVATSVAALTTDSAQVKFKVVDPEGFPISYSITYMRDSDKAFFTNDSAGMPPLLAHPAIITKADSGRATYRFITRQTESDGSGNATTHSYKARFQGTDGARHAISTQNLQLAFSTPVTFDTSLGGWVSIGDNIDQWSFSGTNGTYTAYSSILPTGKKYFESKFTEHGNYPFVGLVVGDPVGSVNYSSTDYVGLYYDGQAYNAGGATGHGSNTVDDVIGIAYNTATRMVWFAKNNDWGTRDPNSSATGYQHTSGNWNTQTPVTYRFGVTNGSSGGVHKGTIHRGSTLHYTPPSGFTSI